MPGPRKIRKYKTQILIPAIAKGQIKASQGARERAQMRMNLADQASKIKGKSKSAKKLRRSLKSGNVTVSEKGKIKTKKQTSGGTKKKGPKSKAWTPKTSGKATGKGAHKRFSTKGAKPSARHKTPKSQRKKK